jgi:ribosomal protein L32
VSRETNRRMNRKLWYRIKAKSLHPIYKLFRNTRDRLDDASLKFHFCPNCGQNICRGKSCSEMQRKGRNK